MSYKVLGSDGYEYESISAEKLRQWIRENRVEKQTPVMPEGAQDWVFLETLPEFAGDLAASPGSASARPAKRRWRWLVVGLGLLLLAVVVWLFMLKPRKFF